MPPLTLLWALIPRRYLIGAGAAIAALCVIWAAIAHHQHSLKAEYFRKGYGFAADSAREATILRLQLAHSRDSAVADSAVASARQLSVGLDSAHSQFANVVRHSPRIEAVALPAGIDTSMVSVFVENTNERFILPRRAAQYWHVSDSLVTVASQLLQKYAAANKQWAAAWADEHAARIGSDSLAEQWRLRALAGIPTQASSHWKRTAALAAAAFTFGAIAHNNLRIR